MGSQRDFKKWYIRLLMRANKTVASQLRSSRLLTKLLFGVTVSSGTRPQFWDYTTLVLRKSLKLYATDDQRTLEIGPGENALLSLYLLRCSTVTASAVELDPAVAEHARRAVERNSANLSVQVGDMFYECAGEYDLIFWNPPYVPSSALDKELIGKQSVLVSDGGDDGTTLIRRLAVEAPDYLAENGKILLGFSTFYLPLTTLQEIIESSDLQIEKIIRIWPVPSTVLVLVHRQSDQQVQMQPGH